MDIEDLSENDFMIVCYENKEENKFLIYVWKGSSISLDEDNYNEYLKKIQGEFFHTENIDKIKIIEEIPFSETDEFINLL